MTIGRTILATCASALVLAAPAVAGGAATVGYEPAAPAKACMTKPLQSPDNAAQSRASAGDWWKTPSQSEMTMRMPSSRNPNDFATPLTTFPTVFEQPRDNDGKKTVTLSVSTCDGRA